MRSDHEHIMVDGRLTRVIKSINAKEPSVAELSDEELKARSAFLKERLAASKMKLIK